MNYRDPRRRKEKNKEYKTFFEEIIVGNFSNMGKDKVNQV